MRLMESAMFVLERVITVIDQVINWFLEKFDWLWDLVVWAMDIVRPFVNFALNIVYRVLDFVKGILSSFQHTWSVSQEVSENEWVHRYTKCLLNSVHCNIFECGPKLVNN